MKFTKHLLFLFFALLSVSIVSCDREDEDDEYPNDQADQTKSSGLVARYSVSGNTLSLIESGPAASGFYNQTRQNEFWNFFTNLIPSDARQVMKELELFADPDDGTAAYVSPINDNDLSLWIMGHNLDFIWDDNNQFVPGESAYTSIHEIAHLLTLDNNQVNVGNSGCSSFHTGEGCSNTDSYINQFYNQFWADIYGELQSIDQQDFGALFAFYNKYQDRFVTEYAATNPGEDIAESFATYVLADAPSEKDIVNRKMSFFDGFPELVNLKARIKGNINFTISLPGIRGERSKRFMARVGSGI
ncbi:hypothetical protein [Roseivirga sp. E12]|uniref:hypothetical protein n=1 Tax=Roseivirga sp. E12 TaxID=2819237 RepID=UPI001ABCB696|nr:hypothetical protein [Roseivirga sp. E12]MBO3698447.1 hypothetical protein [Roseivirga sp. E12]